ncbi:helix-turn-helix transcriptional regulator [Brachybacterium paraconglomeratum]
MSGLSDLLQHLNTEGWSSRRIERETEKHGRKISYATVSRYLNGTHPRNPDAGTLQALADAFGVHVNELRNALGRPGVGEPFDLGEDGARLTGPQREAIRTTVRLFVEQNDALADRPQPDGATIRELRPRPWYEEEDVAADTGVRELDVEDAEAAGRGEESQDPDDHR